MLSYLFPKVFSNPCSSGNPKILFIFLSILWSVLLFLYNDLFLIADGSPLKVPSGTVLPSESTCMLVARLLDSAAKLRRFSGVYGYVSGFMPVGQACHLSISTLPSEISFAGIIISLLVRSPSVFIFMARPFFVIKTVWLVLSFPQSLRWIPKSLNVSNVICS